MHPVKFSWWGAVLLTGLAAVFTAVSCTAVPSWMINDQPSLATQYALAKVSPAVVRIDVVTQDYEDAVPVSYRAIGSGVIIDDQGHILTNFHVAGRADRIDITLANQEEVRATLVGSDHWTDMALVQMDMDQVHRDHLSFQWANLGDSDQVQLGQPVLAIGTPYGLSRTVTSGIISNTDRFFDDASIDGYETGWFNNWLQTDAAINPGNSGGPLINLRGEVIGINTRGDPDANNLGFAIPINVARYVIPLLLKFGQVQRSYIGLELAPLHDFSEYYHLPIHEAVLVQSVDPDSPAEAAGLQAQDLLLSVNGFPTNCRFPEQLATVRRYIADQPVGTTLTLAIDRPGTTGELTPMQFTLKTELLDSVESQEHLVKYWGIVVRDLTHAYLRDVHLPLTTGVLVTQIRSGSIADVAGMQSGDIILRVNAQSVDSSSALMAVVDKLSASHQAVAVVVSRDSVEYTLALTPDTGN
jgi:serine protease Do